MSFKLLPNESFGEGIKRITVEQIDKALQNLEGEVDDRDEAVHDARVCIKKIRALLRLVRYSLGDQVYAAEDESFRDTARGLAKVRDRAAMLETLDLLTEHAKGKRLEAILQNVRDVLGETKAGSEDERTQAMSSAAVSLREARERVGSWPDATHHLSIAKGLKRIFKQGRDRFEEGFELGTTDAFHEWRKSVKHLLYQTRILRPLWPSMLKALACDLKKLSEFLSADHDLAILKKKITGEMDLGKVHTQDEIDALLSLIEARRSDTQKSAHSLGARVYADKPRAFAKRIQTCWREWQSSK